MLRHVALVRTYVSEELSASIRVTRIDELGTMLVTASVVRVHRFVSPWWRRGEVPPKRRFLQEPHCVTSQKTPFFIATAVKTSNLTSVAFSPQESYTSTAVNLSFLDQSRYFFFKIAPHLCSRDWVDPVPDPLLFRKSGSAGNRTWTSGSAAKNSDH
jgi:hypothetical protein